MSPLVVTFGGGVNSTAMLVGMSERGVRPDRCFFADTGAEKPQTYAHLDAVDAWCSSVGFPPVERVRRIRKDGSWVSLEDDCLRSRRLPSIAYGFKSCSDTYKARPVRAAVVAAFGSVLVRYAIGYDADEPHRVRASTEKNRENWFPLVEWGWSRRECVTAITRAGLPMPPKSSCFFCPSMRPYEIVNLGREHPDLLKRAIRIEEAAAADRAERHLDTVIVGLGRDFRWSDVDAADRAQIDLFRPARTEMPCGCYDGDADDPEPLPRGRE